MPADRSDNVQRFVTVIEEDDETTMCAIPVPFNPKAVFGRVRAPVRVTLGPHTYRSTICSMGGRYWIPLNKANRTAAGVAAGQSVAVVVTHDGEPRVVETPPDLAAALQTNPTAQAAWNRLSYTHRREHVEAIEGAKRPETRVRRVAKTVALLSE